MIALDDNAVGAIVAALDIALKAGGLAAFGPVSAAMAALEAAKRCEIEAAELAKLEASASAVNDGVEFRYAAE